MEAKEFGSYLRELRKNANLTMRKLDSLSGVSHSYISQLERGERGIPSPDILKKLADPLNISYMDLLHKAGHSPVGDQSNNRSLRKMPEVMNAISYKGLLYTIELIKEKLFVNDEFPQDLASDFEKVLASQDLKLSPSLFLDSAESFFKERLKLLREEDYLEKSLNDRQRWKAYSTALEYLENLITNENEDDTLLDLMDNELSTVLKRPGLSYKGRKLSKEEKNRILNMIELLLPNEQSFD
ncbi:helix-turn-helix domain-containing protein [Paenibacillus lemnae]|uniref:Helix-turn-helix transcriptional regulator n=1 Tax=Paenibacillus lemnae TaxID=1330551 RepID=A0A848MBB2_PAELE|nr:helix-turn-helix transcriptional regulator [Paenibacillus lemnae]